MSTEMLYPVVREALAQCGVERDAIDYQVAGSADYIDGRPFGFVAALDVMGSWPPRQDSHLEMDAAFAAYYAWIRMQAGECDTAIVVGYGKISEGEPERVLNLQLDPYYQAPLGLDPIATAALQASAYMARTGATDRDLADGRGAQPRRRRAQPRRAGARGGQRPRSCSRRRGRSSRCARATCRRSARAPTCLVLAAEGKAEKMCEQPAWIHGVDQRTELQTLGARDLTRSASAAAGGARRRSRWRASKSARDVDVVELLRHEPGRGADRARGARARRARRDGTPVINPSGGPLCRQPDHDAPASSASARSSASSSGRAGERTRCRARGAPSRTRRRDTACSRTSSGCSARERRWS